MERWPSHSLAAAALKLVGYYSSLEVQTQIQLQIQTEIQLNIQIHTQIYIILLQEIPV